MHYIHNLETNKIEIHTGGKDKWLKLPADVKDHIKRYCNFSRSADAWISKGQAGSIWWTDKLVGWGFENQGTTGEKLSFEERIERQQERAEARAERYEERADKAEAQSNSLHAQSHAIIDGIPMGQPILVGHHSEGRHRRDLDRSWNALGKAVEAGKKAEYYTQRAETAARTAAGAALESPRYLGNRIKERKADIRTYERRLNGQFYSYDTPGSHEVTDEQRAKYEERLEELRAELAFFEKCLSECSQATYNKEALKGMTHVKIRGRWEAIVKLNPTTVSVPNTCFPSEESQRKYALKYAYTEVQDAANLEEQKAQQEPATADQQTTSEPEPIPAAQVDAEQPATAPEPTVDAPEPVAVATTEGEQQALFA